MSDNDLIFDDYISEFNGNIPFDSETCPVYGVKISDSVAVANSPFVELFSSASVEAIETIARLLENQKIHYRIYKEADNSTVKEVRYIYRVVVMIKDLEIAKKITTSQKH